MDVTYSDCDEDGFSQGGSSLSIPKWRIPDTQFQKDFIMPFFPSGMYPAKERNRDKGKMSGHDIRNEIILIEKSMSPMAIKAPLMPDAFVFDQIEWVIKSRREGKPISIDTLIKMIKDPDRRQKWVDSWQRKYEGERKVVASQPKDYTVVKAEKEVVNVETNEADTCL